MGRRSKLEIMVKVLEIIQKGERKPTRIMYGANLSWNLLCSTLDSLVSQELVEILDPSEHKHKRDKRTSTEYILTAKGLSVLKYFNNARTLLDTRGKVNQFQFS
ncbi:winged helix-turn-helix domain-containing protein [Thermoproteota archaeon]